MLVIGFVVFIGSIAQLFGAFANVGSDPFGSFGSVVQSFFFAFVGSIAGMLLIGLGGLALRFGVIRPVTSYVATEASPAIRTASAAIGEGLREGLGDRLGATPVRVRCRNCGYLESEDAKYCSQCAQPM